MPTLRQLEYLVTVADLGSFTRAAAELHVSQPTLSSQIAVLEREVGGSLLDRLPRTVRLTPAGRALIPHAESGADRGTADPDRGPADGRAGRWRARCGCGALGDARTPAGSAATLAAGPSGGTTRLHEYRHGDELTAAMRNGEADVAIGPTPDDWSGDLVSLGDEELLIVLASDDPLAGWRGPLELTLLADRAWVHFAPGHGLAELLDKACAKAGFSPKVALRAEQTASAPLLAAAGLGPTLVPASIISTASMG